MISFEPPAPESVPQENLPVVALYKTVSDSVEQLVNASWKNPFEIRSDEVVANPFTWSPTAYRPPANEDVAVEVAVRYASVGEVLETNAPESLMVRIPWPNEV